LKTAILSSDTPIYSQGNYDVFVGALEETDLPMYVVINRDSKVVEFTHAVTLAYRQWLQQVEAGTAALEAEQSLKLPLEGGEFGLRN
jgi:hypothetical protein